MECLELRGLTKTFPNGVEAVSSIDLTVAAGEFLTVVGPSGSGKSTLLRMIAGLETPSAGSIAIGGRDVTAWSPRERDVAMVFQDPALFPYLSVFDNLAFGLRARGAGRAEVKSRVESVATTFGMTGELTRRPATLSGGQKQRVALGRAVARQPAVFLFDEPLSRLDAPLRASIRVDLANLHQRLGATMIFVTHDQEEALALGDRVAVMQRGRIVQLGTPREVYERPVNRFVAGFIGSPTQRVIPCTIEPGDGPEPFQLDLQGSRHLVGLRPEHVTLAADSDARNPAFVWLDEPSEVVRIEFLGHESIATVRLGATELEARLPGATTVKTGDRLAIGLDLARASWFDPVSHSRIAMPPPAR